MACRRRERDNLRSGPAESCSRWSASRNRTACTGCCGGALSRWCRGCQHYAAPPRVQSTDVARQAAWQTGSSGRRGHPPPQRNFPRRIGYPHRWSRGSTPWRLVRPGCYHSHRKSTTVALRVPADPEGCERVIWGTKKIFNGMDYVCGHH